MSKKREYIYKKTIHAGIFKHPKTGRYTARKKVYGVQYQETFDSVREAIHWRNTFDGSKKEEPKNYSTLKEVWESMKRLHFPKLSNATKQVWLRRYKNLETIEHLPMNEITSTVINEWIEYWVSFYKSEEWQTSGSGKLSRCNLKNELNLFVTIFNWYKCEDEYEIESKELVLPVRNRHREMTFIKDIPVKDKKIEPAEVLKFLDNLSPLYKDLALMQYFCAGRIGETSGIQIKNINLTKRVLKIKDTCLWCQTNKTFLELKPFPKNKESRDVYIHDELLKIIERRIALKSDKSDYLFHVEGQPLNYGTIQINYRSALRKAKLPYTGTHILRHGMATLARKIGGNLDSVMAMTGHKTIKLADKYSRIDHELQKDVSLKIESYLKELNSDQTEIKPKSGNVIDFPKRLA